MLISTATHINVITLNARRWDLLEIILSTMAIDLSNNKICIFYNLLIFSFEDTSFT